jgi:hypothetical protein
MTDPHVQRRLVFGRDRDVGVAEEVVGRSRSGAPAANPCVVAFGPGPEGATCSSCTHLFARGDTAGRYLKCDLRRFTGGPATDHRAGWPACARFEERSTTDGA